MNLIIVLTILFMIAGIVLLQMQASRGGRKREQFLDMLAEYVGGRISPLEGFPNSYRITFRYKGREFTFDDIEDQGFNAEVLYKGYLRLRLSFDLAMSFTERPRGFLLGQQKVSSDINLPKALKDFSVYCNKHEIVNKAFEKDEVCSIFARYKNIDSRGHPVESLDVKGGLVTLRFHPQGEISPFLSDLLQNLTSVDDHLDRLVVLAEKMESARKEVEG